MISVEQAKQFINQYIQALPPVKLPLDQAFHKLLAEDIYAPIDLPAFDQAGMDGYAFCFEENKTEYRIIGEVAAGDDVQLTLQPGEAVRIFTGAAVPMGADTVIMQEKTDVRGAILILKDENIKKGQNYRFAGSDIQKGKLAVKAGYLVTPAIAGFLAALGLDQVTVFSSPRVAILVTGDELQRVGEPLSFGQIYEANSYSLRAALHSMGITSVFIHVVPDDLQQLEKCINEAMKLSDMLLITGGVSVGDHDHTLNAILQSGFKIIFHGVRQKPGKPLLFGMKGSKPVFGLPGNPSSVLTCFYQYVYPAIAQLMKRDVKLETTSAIIQTDYQKPAGITHFLRAELLDGNVNIRKGQESYRLESFAYADAFIVLPEEVTQVNAGDQVIVQKIPY